MKNRRFCQAFAVLLICVIGLSLFPLAIALESNSKISGVKVIGQNVEDYGSRYTAALLVDGIFNDFNDYFWGTKKGTTTAYVTFDMGGTVSLEKLLVYARPHPDFYKRCVNNYAIYVSDTPPSYNGMDGTAPELTSLPIKEDTLSAVSASSPYGTIELPEETEGRYVTLHIKDLQGGPQLDIAEIEFYGNVLQDEEKNLDSLKKTAISSIYSTSTDSRYQVESLYDGDISDPAKYWSSAYNQTAELTVTLEQMSSVEAVVLYPGQNPINFPGKIEISVSADNTSYKTVLTEQNFTTTSTDPQYFSFELSRAKYIKVKLTKASGRYYSQVLELEVLSRPLMSTEFSSVVSTSTDPRYPIENLYDGDISDPSKYWSNNSGGTAEVTTTLEQMSNVEAIILYPGQHLVNFPGTITISVSSDQENYTTVVSESGFKASTAVPIVFDFPITRAKYIKAVFVPASGRSYSQVLEMEVLSRPLAPTEISSVVSTSTDSRYPIENLYDNDISDPSKYWSNSYSKASDLTVTLEKENVVSGVVLYPGQHLQNFPASIEISVLNEAQEYKTVFTQSDYTVSEATPQYFLFPPQNNVKNIQVKLNFKSGGYYTQVLEMQVLREANPAEATAASFAELKIDYEKEKLIIPQRNNCLVEILSSSNQDVISNDGFIKTVSGGSSEVILKVTDSDGNTANSAPITVNVLSLRQQMAIPAEISSVTASTYDGQKNAGLLINGNIDGGRHGHFYSSAKDAAQAEIVLTMEEAGLVNGVTLYPRHASITNFPYGIEVYTSQDGETWADDPVFSLDNIKSYNSTEPQTYFFAPQSDVKYVKLILKREADNINIRYIQLAEIEILTTPDLQTAVQAAENLKVVQSGETIVFEDINAQFSVVIKESDDESIISTTGMITPPSTVTPVTLTLDVTNRLDPDDTVTVTRTVSVKTKAMLDVERIAAEIDLIACPANDANKIDFPTVPNGYTISIVESDTPSVVDTSGNITRSDDTTYPVRLTFEVTDTENGVSARTKALLVPIYKTYKTPTMSEAEIEKIRSDYEAKKYGAFVHYITSSDSIGHGTRYADGNMLRYIDEAADAFDVKQFAKDMKDFGVEYVVLTVWHHEGETLFPSMTNQRWRDDRRKEESKQKSYSDRDVIKELLDELDQYGIDLHLYAHGSAGTDYNAEDIVSVGWNDAANSYGVYNQYINEMFYELCERYGTRLKGLWIDGLFSHIPAGAAQQRLRETCQSFNPAMILTMNAAFNEGKLDLYPQHNMPDYRCWEINRWVDYINDLKFSRYQVATCLAQQYWWTTRPQEYSFDMQPADEMFQYIVALSSITQQGGILASTGIYPVPAEQHGQENNIWLNGMKDMLLKVNSYLDPVAESVKNTAIGKAFPTTENITVADLDWGVSTESRDGKNVYLHVLKAPESNTLVLPATADGSVLSKNAVIMNYDKSTTPITVTKTETGYSITLPEGVSWNDVDTVIKTTRLEDPTACEHDFSIEVEGTRINATCSSEGSVTMKCHLCEITEVQTLPADETAHKWEVEYTVDTEAALMQAGSKSIHCEYCDESDPATAVEIPAISSDTILSLLSKDPEVLKSEGAYSLLWTMMIDPNAEFDFGAEDIRFTSYGMIYSNSEEKMEEYVVLNTHSEQVQEIHNVKRYAYDEAEEGKALTRIYKTYRHEITKVPENKKRFGMAYIRFEYNGETYEVYSPITDGTILLGGMIGGNGPTIEEGDTLDD